MVSHIRTQEAIALDLVREDALGMLVGELIGSGQFRDVYEANLMPGFVVKIERSNTLHNVSEFQAYCSVINTPMQKWFAHVERMSANGKILIMERTVKPGPDQFPDKLPVFLCDRKHQNFGLTVKIDPKTGKPEHRFVCHDYGNHFLHEDGLTRRMSKANWIPDA